MHTVTIHEKTGGETYRREETIHWHGWTKRQMIDYYRENYSAEIDGDTATLRRTISLYPGYEATLTVTEIITFTE